MKCIYCGNEINDGSIYCSYCNAQLYNPQQPQQGYTQQMYTQQSQQGYTQQMYTQQPQQGYVNRPANKVGNKPDLSKLIKDKRFLIGAVVVVLLLVFLGGGRKEVIDFEDYVSFKYKGVDGYGYYVCNFDDEEFLRDLEDIMLENDDSRETSNDLYEFYIDLKGSFGYGNNKNLSNGDKITFEINIDKDALKKYDVKFENTELTDKVSGLEKGEVVNPFENYDIYVEKDVIDGSYKLHYEKIDDSDPRLYHFYLADISDDKFTIKVKENNIRAHSEDGYRVEPTSMTINADNYFQKIADIDDISELVISKGNEDVINRICEEEGSNPADFELYAYATIVEDWPQETYLYFIYSENVDGQGEYHGYGYTNALINNSTGEIKFNNTDDELEFDNLIHTAQFRLVEK